ncbi:protein MHF1 homolog [Punica granatum]|uniref:Protein MHF1 homolog n=1 Tax=Punica granatum TaxID=22663 RepID=A0A6P8CLZ7_PUNGR|nr:protein MHF1 homolog [Punica granatum]
MDGGKEGGGEEEESVREVLRDRLRLSSISIAQSQALRDGMEVSDPVLACIADLSFKYAEQLAINVEQFARHAGRKYVNMEDVILSAHRNEQLARSLRSFSNGIKVKEPQSEKKRKKTSSRKEEKAAPSTIHVLDL